MSTAISRFRAFMPYWCEPHSYRVEIIQFLFDGPVFVMFNDFPRDFLFFDWALPPPSFDDVVSATRKASPDWIYKECPDIDKTTWAPETHWALFMLRIRAYVKDSGDECCPSATEPDEGSWKRQLYETLLYERHLWLVENNLREDYETEAPYCCSCEAVH